MKRCDLFCILCLASVWRNFFFLCLVKINLHKQLEIFFPWLKCLCFFGMHDGGYCFSVNTQYTWIIVRHASKQEFQRKKNPNTTKRMKSWHRQILEIQSLFVFVIFSEFFLKQPKRILSQQERKTNSIVTCNVLSWALPSWKPT